jgi:2,3-bisphosphoglycerate-dependent phosphoglycerate mutase
MSKNGFQYSIHNGILRIEAMTEELKIYLVRHAKTLYNVEERFTGTTDVDLLPDWLQVTRLIVEKLRVKKFQVAYHTRLKRSKKTMHEIIKSHPEVIEVIEDNRIIERSYGKLQKQRHKDFIAKYGEDLFNKYHRSYEGVPPGGENLQMVEVRVLDFIQDLLAKMKREKVSVLICGHSNAMRPFRRYFEGLTIEEMMALENPWDEVFEYTVPLEGDA